jgi:hypothetical protein
VSSRLHQALLAKALLERFESIAEDLGRLRGRFDSNGDAWTGVYLVERLAGNVEALDVMLHPSAAELYRDFLAYCGDDKVALEESLAVVDRRAARLRRLLGERER